MSRTRNYSEQTKAIMQRFYDTLQFLKDNKTIRGTATYCNRYGIDRRHLLAQSHDLNKGFFEVSWIVPLVTDFNISAQWLLTGKGGMFNKRKSAKATQCVIEL